jgi:hypothetical protein
VFPYVSTTSNITVDKYDYYIKASVLSGNVTVTLPGTPPTGKRFIIWGVDDASSTVLIEASGSTTVGGVSSYDLNQTARISFAFVIYDGAGNYDVMKIDS